MSNNTNTTSKGFVKRKDGRVVEVTVPRDEATICEPLLKAEHGLGFAVSDLRAALHGADAVQGIVLLRLIEDAAKLERRISELREAVGR